MFASVLCLLSFLALSQSRGINNSVDIGPRIVNGENSQLSERPYQVSLQYKTGEHFCGGSIVSSFFVLTAAHCIIRLNLGPYDIYVSAGSVSLKEQHDVYRAVLYKVHEEYYAPGNINDIAVIKVNRKFEFSNRIMPVVLPAPHEIVPANTEVEVSGWGNLVSEDPNVPDILQKATIYVADQDYCKKVNYEKHYPVLPTMICANDPSMRRGQCSGDSGSPLTIGNKIVGIVSMSVKDTKHLCASTKYPGIYTRVSEFVDWINDHIKLE